MSEGKSMKRPSRQDKTVDGLVVVASTGGNEKPMPEPTDELAVVNRQGKRVHYACGHDDHVMYSHNFFGEVLTLTKKILAKREKCAECMLADVKPHIIRCAACGFAIMPGESVALYADNGKFNPKWAKTVGEGERRNVIGCLRWNCCPSGGFFAGYWTEQGFEPAFGGESAIAAVLRSGRTIITNT